jgi:hypothetical protein
MLIRIIEDQGLDDPQWANMFNLGSAERVRFVKRPLGPRQQIRAK